ncbi:GlpM family protein [Stenotrophomonas mori]|uniref:GlpM family protein n=1 Tax=Stenotrophomonas mori TaxID=2871096 RepID=A0ABT0SFZ1_9GAMM|nr:GlpM family protein [Stenotrophomonas mori]MCL7714241.1 GlpM family protein [Stenotrophomonas mori]
MLSLFLKSLLGALAVLLIALLARSKSFFIAGLVPLFPTFALIAHYIVGSERSGGDLQKTALFGLWSLFPYAGYLAVVYVGSVRWPLAVTLGAATAVWLLMAVAMILLWGRLHPALAGG